MLVQFDVFRVNCGYEWCVGWVNKTVGAKGDSGGEYEDHVVGQLRPHTTYTVRVIAVNVVGQSRPSQPSLPATTACESQLLLHFLRL